MSLTTCFAVFTAYFIGSIISRGIHLEDGLTIVNGIFVLIGFIAYQIAS